MSRTSGPKTQLVAAVTAMCAIGLLVGTAPAHAAPCDQWGFTGSMSLKQKNGWTLYFDSTGSRALGATEAVSQGGHMKGTIEGGINGSNVSLVARWTSGPIGKYEGQVHADGYMTGITYDATNQSSTATWFSNQQLQCITPGRQP